MATTPLTSVPDDADAPAVVVSCDSHVGPLLRGQLRDYCPAEHLDAFDAFADAHEAALAESMARRGENDREAFASEYPEGTLPGHHDIDARIADMDREGVAAEVIYHFSMNGEPLPFVTNPAGGLGAVSGDALAMGAVGYRIYNRWLADFVSVQPERHVGLAYLPTWDIDAAVAEVEWAADAGLKGVNFPPPGRPGHLEYNHPAWEPFWSACEANGMALHTHSGNAAAFDYFGGPGGQDLLVYECGGWMGRRAVWWLIHGRVFARHPDLKLVITEQYEGWWTSTLRELDAVYVRFGWRNPDQLPELPSEYARRNVLLGASFLSKHLAAQALQEGFVDNVLWGRDYPHIEGSFHVFDGPPERAVSRLALRNTLAGLPVDAARAMAGENAVRALGLDREALARVAARIGAPSGAELVTPPADLPPVRHMSNAFRGQAGARALDEAVAARAG